MFTTTKRIYTDGSETKSGVGYVAIVTNETKITQSLASLSIFTAEAYAILEALQYAHSNNEAQVVIYIDSTSVTKALMRPCDQELRPT